MWLLKFLKKEETDQLNEERDLKLWGNWSKKEETIQL